MLGRHHHTFQPRQRRAQPLPRKLQLAAVMGLEAHHPVGERVVAAIDQQLEEEEFAARLRHFPGPLDQEVVVHPYLRAGILRSEEHTDELQSLMRISYAVFFWKKKKTIQLTDD